MKEEKKLTYTLREIDPDIWRAFKVKCAQDEISMREKMSELIEEYVKGKK